MFIIKFYRNSLSLIVIIVLNHIVQYIFIVTWPSRLIPCLHSQNKMLSLCLYVFFIFHYYSYVEERWILPNLWHKESFMAEDSTVSLYYLFIYLLKYIYIIKYVYI